MARAPSLWGLILLVVALAGCEGGGAKSEARRTSEDEGSRRRCGDFLSETEARELGVEGYQPGKGDTAPARGVVCTTHPVVVTVHMAARLPEMKAGARALRDFRELTGPAVGQQTLWFETPDAKQVMLLTPSGRYALGISAPSVELAARAATLAAEGR
jgi:hypothetical protein